jgi:hypothetical protein
MLEYNVTRTGKDHRKLTDQSAGKILVEEKFHAEAARRRSCMAANERAART